MRIRIFQNREKALLKPLDFLGGDTFKRYLEATRKVGATYVKEQKAQMLTIDAVPLAVEALQLAGFMPMVDRELQDSLKTMAQSAQVDITAAKDRMAATDVELKKRGLELFAFQRNGVAWLAHQEQALLCDEMGLGKTIQALISIPNNAPVIVICPAALKGSDRSASGWHGECRKWRPDLTPVTLKGRGSFYWPQPGQMILVNYDILPDLPLVKKEDAELFQSDGLKGLECAPGTVLIADECHALKNRRAIRSQRFRAMAEEIAKKGGRLWGLTGTPLLNQPLELWNLLETFDLAERSFGHFGGFYKHFGGYKTGYGVEWGQPSAHVPGILQKVMLARRREQVLPDLPTKIWRNEIVPIEGEAKEACDELEQMMPGERLEEAWHDDGTPREDSSIPFSQLSKTRAKVAEAKIPALMEFVEAFEASESGDPLVVFSDHRAPVDTLAQRPGWDSITGDTPPHKRNEIVDAFQGGRLKGLALTIPAGGVGITLTRAHQAVFVDMNWTPALNKQAEDRLCRIGQTRGVIITRLVANHPLDQRITEVLAGKQALIEASVDKARRDGGEIETIADKVEKMGRLPGTTGITKAPENQTAPAEGREKERTSKALNGQGRTDPPHSLQQEFMPPAGRRGPNDLERQSIEGLKIVAAMDLDRARSRNGVGFSKFDGDFGHSLVDTYVLYGQLTEKQWAAVLKLARKYKRQIGGPTEKQEA